MTADNFQQIKNKKVTIPQTGGIGTLVFTIVGLSTMMVFAFIAMKKRQSEEA
ncbi:LPXTG cell wall anchor domain-containing protein [Streptococcus suis]|uniref:LPXTG cell wall anchor domain-containing protein n=1 Tax=Streptococcus suis TaxID=1307 RepID=UPI000944CCF6|nr:LPXTG cell wall anchor domain-containing protein [Streptococcus suis]